MSPSSSGDQPAEVIPEHVSVVEENVRIERSVRYGRVIVGMALLGAVVAAIFTLSFPVASKDYTMAQVVGLMMLIGAGAGLAVGSLLALILAASASKRRGTAVAKRSDVG